MKEIGSLHVITDTALQSRFTHAELAELAIDGGADTIQFRQKTGATRELVEIAAAVQGVCARRGTPLIVNDRADIALAVGAAGMHLGQEDLPVPLARRIAGSGPIVGASARTEEKILAAIAAGADYVGYGPIYATSSKPDAEEPEGLQGLRRICAMATCPVIAIGGITRETAAAVIRAGAHGIAVIAAVCCQPDPAAATRQLMAEIQRGRHERET